MRAAPRTRQLQSGIWFLALLTLLAALLASSARAQGEANSGVKTAGGMTVYIGLVPAAMLKSHLPTHTEREMHGGAPKGIHETHLTVAVFDAATGNRIEDAVVYARISPLQFAGERKQLEPMRIADTTTYGQFFNFPGADSYTITVEVQKAGAAAPVRFDFPFAHMYSTGP